MPRRLAPRFKTQRQAKQGRGKGVRWIEELGGDAACAQVGIYYSRKLVKYAAIALNCMDVETEVVKRPNGTNKLKIAFPKSSVLTNKQLWKGPDPFKMRKRGGLLSPMVVKVGIPGHIYVIMFMEIAPGKKVAYFFDAGGQTDLYANRVLSFLDKELKQREKEGKFVSPLYNAYRLEAREIVTNHKNLQAQSGCLTGDYYCQTYIYWFLTQSLVCRRMTPEMSVKKLGELEPQDRLNVLNRFKSRAFKKGVPIDDVCPQGKKTPTLTPARWGDYFSIQGWKYAFQSTAL